MYRHFFKRVLFVLIALCGLIVCAIPMVIIAILIKCDSKGPALFKQERLGKEMKTFTCYKFRTMCQGAFEKGGIASSESDSRITKVASIILSKSATSRPARLWQTLPGQLEIKCGRLASSTLHCVC